MCNRHDKYEEDSNYRHYDIHDNNTWDRIFYELHLYLVPLENWEAVKQKVQIKIKELWKKRVERSRQIVHEVLDCSKVDDEVFWELTEKLEENDLLFRQYAVGHGQLVNYLKGNDYFEGRKTSLRHLPYDLQHRIKYVNCKHNMYSHDGEYSEGECHGAGQEVNECKSGCKKLVLSSEDNLLLQRLSGTKEYDKGLDGKIKLGEKLSKILAKPTSASPSVDQIYEGICYTGEQAWKKRHGKKQEYEDDEDEYDEEFEDDESEEEPKPLIPEIVDGNPDGTCCIDECNEKITQVGECYCEEHIDNDCYKKKVTMENFF